MNGGTLMRLKTAFWMALLLVTFYGCSGGPNKDYFPYHDGARWEYAVEAMVPFSGVQKGKVISRVDGEETINGKKYYKLVTVYSGIPGAEAEVLYLRKAKDGIYKIDGKYKDNPEYLLVPLPLAV